VRMALHTGAAEQRDGDYFGPPLNRVARLLMAGHGGQVLLSLAAAELVREHLPPDAALRDLGRHRLKDLSLPEQIYQLIAPDLPADFPALKTLDARRTNLLAQPTALLGRAQELASVCTLLRRADVRLVSLTGPGGTGKTRLALQVAAELLDAFDDGVWFVDLAPLSDANLVIATIMQTLQLKEIGGQPALELLKTYLHDKQVLLILDNFEQVVEAASQLAALLAAAPQLKVLVTSRIVLRLRGEQEYAVPPLALPDLKHLPALDVLSQYAAVELFIQRAQAVQPDFQVTNANAPAVAEICYRLDGLPLAIELAAARIKLFSPQALLQRLDRRLKFLTGGARDLPSRQQTIRNAIDWSYHLLEDGEKTLFARLGVFVGGCTLEAAEAVCDLNSDLLFDLVDGIAALIDKSLLRQIEGASGEPRFLMLETVREYALERLAAIGEAEALRQQHAAYYLALAEAAERELVGRDQLRWVACLDAEQDNLRAALEWSVQNDIVAGLRLASALRRYWEGHSPLQEGIGWLEQLLRHPRAAVHTATRAKALNALSWLNTWQNEYASARGQSEAALAIYRALGDQHGIASALLALGGALSMQEGYAVGRPIWLESLALYRALGDTFGISEVLSMLGSWESTQDDAQSRAYLEEGLALSRELDDIVGMASFLDGLGVLALRHGDYAAAHLWLTEALTLQRSMGNTGVAHAIAGLGELALAQGEYELAGAFFEESVALCRESGQIMVGSWAIARLGYVALRQGDMQRADVFFREGLQHFKGVGNRIGIVYTIEGLASLAVAQGNPARAVRLFAWADTIRVAIDNTRPPVEQVTVDRDFARIHAQLDQATIEIVSAAGQAMSQEQAISYALEAGSGDHASQTSGEPRE
jgi:predicted ATPase